MKEVTAESKFSSGPVQSNLTWKPSMSGVRCQGSLPCLDVLCRAGVLPIALIRCLECFQIETPNSTKCTIPSTIWTKTWICENCRWGQFRPGRTASARTAIVRGKSLPHTRDLTTRTTHNSAAQQMRHLVMPHTETKRLQQARISHLIRPWMRRSGLRIPKRTTLTPRSLPRRSASIQVATALSPAHSTSIAMSKLTFPQRPTSWIALKVVLAAGAGGSVRKDS